MKAARHPAVRLGIVIACGAVLAACDEEILVRTDSRVYAQGGVARRIEIFGKEPDGSTPTAADWLESNAGVRLARPEAWSHVDAAPGRLTAEGFFRGGADLVPTLAHTTSGEPLSDHTSVELASEDLVVATRWTWRETAADPYGSTDGAAAAERLLALLARALREELERTFGSELDPAPAERFFRNDVRKLLVDLLPSIRSALARPGASTGVAKDAWRKVVARHGIPVTAAGSDLFSNEQIQYALEWSRARTARALSTRQRPLAPEELSFWPLGDDAEEQATTIIRDVWGSEEALADEAGPALEALGGYYGRLSSPRFRFDARLRLPGRLLRTNGTPEADAVVWTFADENLVAKGVALTAESVELSEGPLRALGARLELDAAGLLRLVDLLSGRDASADLRGLLRHAVEKGTLAGLRDAAQLPHELAPAARDLADLLDAQVPALRWAP